MKNLFFSLIATVLITGITNAQDKIPTEGLTVDYFNYLFEHSPAAHKAKVLEVAPISAEKYKELANENPDWKYAGVNNSISIEILVNDLKRIVYVMPLADGNKAVTYIEENDKLLGKYVEVNIDAKGNFDYSTFSRPRGIRISRDCATGAGQIMNMGTAFASLGLAGCIPCAFSGGAILGIAAAMSLFC
jgi:hypothetical protein